ncbi:hypothetical protein [Azospirillum brasilense]|uniref:hypothetical protein n=1 Tax=Azospirillum brasilense TaxID=192 RepID=UPI000E68635C|nr:hypothetical protein [Azospirillum brasilense]NUB27005.1 hypothetical protein [Azospirillum brasilense]NUB34789.1 hypothetical protein [Azospirillum brasilense]RIW01169.1 hypothetical protein D2T81_19155 [Azospirillum brasilense]
MPLAAIEVPDLPVPSHLFEAVGHSAEPLFLALGILVSAALIGGRASIRFGGFRRDLNRVHRAVSAVPVPAVSGEAFAAMGEAFRRTTAFRTIWLEIEAFLVRPEEDGKPIVGTLRPTEFFSIDVLRQANINVGLYQAVPGYLVGAGLLFTFTSLLVALFAATSAMSAATPTATQEALHGLLSAAAMKFSCSIAGLLSSITFSIWLRRRLHELEASLDALGRDLAARIPVRHPIQVITETNALLMRQNAILDAIDRQWRDRLVTELVSGASQALRGGMEPLVDGMNRMADRVSELSRDSMERMIGQFTERLDASMRRHTDKLIEDLQTLHTGFASLMITVGNVDTELAEHIRQGSEALDQRVGAAAACLEKALRDGGAGMAEGLKDGRETLIDTVSIAANDMETRLNATTVQVAATMNNAGEALNRFTETVDAVFKATSVQLNDELTANCDRIGRDLGRVAESLCTTDEQTADALPKLVQGVDGLIGKLSAMNGPLEELARDIGNGSRALGRALANSAKQIDGGQAAFERMSEATNSVAAMQDTFKALAKAVERMETLEVTADLLVLLNDRLPGLDGVVVRLDQMLQQVLRVEAAWSGLANAGATFDQLQVPIDRLAAAGEKVAALEPAFVALSGAGQTVVQAAATLQATMTVGHRTIILAEVVDRLAVVVEQLSALNAALNGALVIPDAKAALLADVAGNGHGMPSCERLPGAGDFDHVASQQNVAT